MTIGNVALEQSKVETQIEKLIAELVRAKTYSEGLLQNMADGLGVLDLQGNVLDINIPLQQMLGVNKEEVLGLPFVQVLGRVLEPEETDKIYALVEQLIAGDPGGATEMTFTGEHGTQRTLSLAPSMVRDPKGNPVMLFGVLRDISQMKRLIRDLEENTAELQASEEELRVTNEELQSANEELREAQDQLIRSERLAAIGQLAGGVGHELRNPLGAIKNAVYYLKGKISKSGLSEKEPRLLEFLDIIDEEVESSDKIITNLLGFSRVGKPAVSSTRIEKVIDYALAHIQLPDNIWLVKELDSLPEVAVDSDLIHQVFLNIFHNAIDAMPEGGELKIGAAEKEGFLQIRLSDSGHGIPKDILGKVFDPLFTTKAKGIGLGLAVCQTIIQRHGGNIAVESEEGKGTTFIVSLLT